MNKYEIIREKYEDKVVNDKEFEEINETSGVYVENCGGSGKYPDKTFYIVYEYDFIEKERINVDEEFAIWN